MLSGCSEIAFPVPPTSTLAPAPTTAVALAVTPPKDPPRAPGAGEVVGANTAQMSTPPRVKPISTPNLSIDPTYCCGGPPPVGAKVQLTDRDEPKTKPKPPATLQVSAPAFTACAWAGLSSANVPTARPSAPIATASFLSIPSVSCLPHPIVEVRSLNVGSYSSVPCHGAMVSSPSVSRACLLLDSTFCRLSFRSHPGFAIMKRQHKG